MGRDGSSSRTAARWRRKSSEGGAVAVGSGGGIQSLGADILCAVFALLDHFDVARCSAVCKLWHSIVCSSTLLRDLYGKRGPNIFCTTNLSVPPGSSLKTYLEELAMEQHRSALLNGYAEFHQWNCHSVRVSQCRMMRGLILSGMGDKVMRLWSAANYQCLREYCIPGTSSAVDFDFDESKVVGLIGSQICIWRHNGRRNILHPREGTFARSLNMRYHPECMVESLSFLHRFYLLVDPETYIQLEWGGVNYIDPEAVVGCEDGRCRVFDMYGGNCSRIIRMHSGPVTCLSLTDEQLILGGSSFGSVTVADLSSGERAACLKSSVSPIGISCLCYNMRSYLVFAGSTAGYSHCWDLRTLKPLWESRISSNVIHAVHHLSSDTSALAAGGIDGVLRILNQQTGEVLSSYLTAGDDPMPSSGDNKVIKYRARALPNDARIDSIPRSSRPSITCLAVGMKKIVTTHNDRYIRLWRFNEQIKL